MVLLPLLGAFIPLVDRVEDLFKSSLQTLVKIMIFFIGLVDHVINHSHDLRGIVSILIIGEFHG